MQAPGSAGDTPRETGAETRPAPRTRGSHTRDGAGRSGAAASAGIVNGKRPDERKRTQRERLIAGMIAAIHRHGYGGANISQTIAHAGVSRPTFYDYFSDKDDCFLAAHAEVGELLLAELESAIAGAPPERAMQAAIVRIVGLSEALPDRGALLVNEGLAGGPRALDQHDRLIARMAATIDQALAQAPAGSLTPDLPTQMALSAGRWLLAPALRRGERDLSEIAEEAVGWVECYLRPTDEHRWRTLDPAPPLAASPHVAPEWLAQPDPPARGRPRLSRAELARKQRERIMYATAETVVAKGYNATTIADVTAAAKVDRRVFYRHFRDRQQAYVAVHELGMQHLMAVSAAAFFSASEWPERVWQAIWASTQFEATHPVVTKFGYIHSHAVGPAAIQRIDNARAAFTIFLQEGNRYAEEPPGRGAMEAIGGAVFEIAYLMAREDRCELIARLAGPTTYLILAPFMGPAAASDFVDAKLREATV
ncbi:MAG TPA: TetR/AcrR family transcriptional regulator [Solirubrobacteraceae bacterium]|jgi:AcrR family transcriptional regulator|nr:TetR/AcrR family transcriptional regulator [Solirubrobacteraceae bacterium]